MDGVELSDYGGCCPLTVHPAANGYLVATNGVVKAAMKGMAAIPQYANGLG